MVFIFLYNLVYKNKYRNIIYNFYKLNIKTFALIKSFYDILLNKMYKGKLKHWNNLILANKQVNLGSICI